MALLRRNARMFLFRFGLVLAFCSFMKTQPIESAIEQRDLTSGRVGTEWIVDAVGCDEAALRSLDKITQLAQAVIDDLGLKVVGVPQAHQFPFPFGVTVLFMLSESHLACHTYPEHRLATFNLYCCRERQAWPWDEQLVARIGAEKVAIRRISRGSSKSLQSRPFSGASRGNA